MSLVEYPPLRPQNLFRTLEAKVPRKFLRDIKNRLQFGLTGPLSDEPLFVSPADVTQSYCPDPRNGAPKFRRYHSGKVRGGDWDLSTIPLKDSDKFESCEMHFVGGVPWEQTPIFDRHYRVIAERGASDGCRSRQDLLHRYSQLDKLFESVQRTGRLLLRCEVDSYFRREHGGIFVHINRKGQPLRSGGGEHRFSIARILNLPEIPVQSGVIHAQAVESGDLARLRQSIYA